jgi:hypothetical protein
MKVPVFTRQQFTDKDGNLTTAVQTSLDVFFQQAQENLSDDGVVIPSLNTSEIQERANPANNNNMPNGTIWYNSEIGKFQVKENNLVKTLVTV